MKLHAEWVRAALHRWRTLAPERFEDIPGWERRPEWMTKEERQLRGRILEVERELDEATRRLTGEREQLKVRLADAQSRARWGLRRLLTAADDELVAAVTHALETLGFGVVDVDEQVADRCDRVEDWHVADPDSTGGWRW